MQLQINLSFLLVDPPPLQAVLKLSMAGTSKDLIFVGALAGNGSGFTPNAATPPGGTMLDLGLVVHIKTTVEKQPR